MGASPDPRDQHYDATRRLSILVVAPYAGNFLYALGRVGLIP